METGKPSTGTLSSEELKVTAKPPQGEVLSISSSKPRDLGYWRMKWADAKVVHTDKKERRVENCIMNEGLKTRLKLWVMLLNTRNDPNARSLAIEGMIRGKYCQKVSRPRLGLFLSGLSDSFSWSSCSSYCHGFLVR